MLIRTLNEIFTNGKWKIISSVYSRSTKIRNLLTKEATFTKLRSELRSILQDVELSRWSKAIVYLFPRKKFEIDERIVLLIYKNSSRKSRRDFPISYFAIFEKYLDLNLRLIWGNRFETVAKLRDACAACNPIYRSEIGWGDPTPPRITTFSRVVLVRQRIRENSEQGDEQGEIRKHPCCRSI